MVDRWKMQFSVQKNKKKGKKKYSIFEKGTHKEEGHYSRNQTEQMKQQSAPFYHQRLNVRGES